MQRVLGIILVQQTQLEKWEQTQREKEMKRLFGEKPSERLMKNPRKEKLRNFRKCEKFGQHFDKEMTKIRRHFQQKFKRKMKERLYNEAYYRPINKDYKTYGWITW